MAERFSEFDAAKAAEALGAEPKETHDVAHGRGQAINVADTTIEVYREAGVARITTPDARIELFRVPGYDVGARRVVFDQGTEDSRTRLLIRGDGRVSFHPVLRGPESPVAGETAPVGEEVSPTGTEPPTGATQRPDGTSIAGPESQEPEQQQLTGRLGRDPWFKNDGEQPAAGFPLAVNGDNGETTWHRVLVFGDVAEQVRTSLQTGDIKKGRPVQLSGTQVVRQESTAKGGTRTITEFHATSVLRMKNTPRPQRS